MKSPVVAAILVGLSSLSGVAAAPRQAIVLHVAVDGNDAWTGASPSPTGGDDGPLASIAGARNRLRSLRAAGTAEGAEVLVHKGTYLVSGPIEFGPEDSGGDGAPIIYRAAPGEDRPIISGGHAVTAWTREGDAWVATLPVDIAGSGGPGAFTSLWFDGVRRPRARTPNEGFLRIADAMPGAKQGFRFFPGDLRPEWEFDPAAGTGAVVTVFHEWEASIHHIRAVHPATQTVSFTAPLLRNWSVFEPSLRYRVENVPEALDAPGEWYFDIPSRRLHYIPVDGEPTPEGRVVIPITSALVRIAGKRSRMVKNLAFEGLGFEHSDWQPPPEGINDAAGGVSPTAAITAEWATGISFTDCRFLHLGGWGLQLGDGCRSCRVERCEVGDLGAGGIKIGQPEVRDPAVDQATGGNTVDNCFIHDGGAIEPAGAGIWIGRTDDNIISHNDVGGFYGCGMLIGWNWGYGPARTSRTRIVNNRVHHIGRGLLGDIGAIYLWGEQPGAKVAHNFIHDVNATDHGFGIYADAGCSHVDFHHNIVANTDAGAVKVHWGRGNRFHNNFFAFSHAGQFIYSGEVGEPSQIDLTRNIFYFNNGLTLGPDWAAWFDNPLNQFTADGNLYWDASGRAPRFRTLDFAGWQARGLDRRGRIADPLFADPQGMDFALRPGSPAKDLGIEPIDLADIGLYGDAEWVNKPASIPREACPLPEPRPGPIADGFEATRVGVRARDAGWTAGESSTDDASIRVSDQQAAHGKHSLEFRKSPQARNDRRTVVTFPTMIPPGPAQTRFSVRFSPSQNSGRNPIMTFDWCARTSGPREGEGPGLRILADGTLVVGARRLFRLPADTWINIAIHGPTGIEGKAGYTVAVSIPGTAIRTVQVPCGVVDRIEHIEFSSPASSDTTFWIDDLVAAPGE